MKKLLKTLARDIVVVILMLAGVAILAVCLQAGFRKFFLTHELAIAAGAPKSDAYILVQALKTVMARQNPPVRIVLVSTAGAADSLDRLQRGAVQLAVSKSDADTPPAARTVTILWEDIFQILVRSGSAPLETEVPTPDASPTPAAS